MAEVKRKRREKKVFFSGIEKKMKFFKLNYQQHHLLLLRWWLRDTSPNDRSFSIPLPSVIFRVDVHVIFPTDRQGCQIFLGTIY
jgi:hypothetical protein